MGRIRILSDNVANKIAAGEVVERPASVVKELLENSLDADAEEVLVDVENAGRRLIRIRDNGSGMLRDDAMLAFERHATSKLSDVKDLLAIGTLGFRGEALPSIASVSRLLLETRSDRETTGTAVEILGGKLIRCDEIARTQGTSVAVRDLFFNVPARKKFLRSDQTEMGHIGSLVTHYSLGHPAKRFELTQDGREVLSVTPVNSIRERAFQVFGADAVDELLDVPQHSMILPDSEGAEFAFSGMISGPHVQRANRASIFLFVNGRLVRDKVLLHATQAAYQNLMPAGIHPFALLFIDCDPGEVDVNVHPAKTEVRFRHGSEVHDFVRDRLRQTLVASRPVSSVPSPHGFRSPGAFAPSEFSAQIDRMPLEMSPAFDLRANEQQLAFRSALPSTSMEAPEIRVPSVYMPADEMPPLPRGVPPLAVVPVQRPTRSIPDTHSSLAGVWDGDYNTDTLAALPDLRPLGQLHESFIIAVGRDGLWLIDQHVAHERILFEQVLRQRAAGELEVQQLLLPIVLQLSPAQYFEYDRIRDELAALGFDTEPFGQRNVAIKSAPAAVAAADLERVIIEIFEVAESELRGASLDDLRRSLCASLACRAAIKINTRLDEKKITWLLNELARCEYPMTCPHGRPICLRYGTRDILKSFHRI